MKPNATNARLKDELDFLERYLEIERTRFQDRLDVSMKIGDGTETAFVPVLLLQPIAENAIRHGLSGKTGASSLEISTLKEGKNLIIDIVDSGAESDAASANPGLGIGLGITRQRLEAMYGNKGRITLEQLPDSKTRVRVTLPFTSEPIFEKRDEGHG